MELVAGGFQHISTEGPDRQTQDLLAVHFAHSSAVRCQPEQLVVSLAQRQLSWRLSGILWKVISENSFEINYYYNWF